ncbi:histidine phosphatase family protein [Candidatus Woesearchaeota archaeon]|nr:histidine phosphatase family protein [Candidatus Woesearchaeota archaeon]
MKKLIFMRHGYLEGKYKDYTSLKFEEFENLLLKKVNPSIDEQRTEIVLRDKEIISSIDFIVCSDEKRAMETAEIVKKITGVNFETSHSLREVTFFKGIITTNDIEDFHYLRTIILTRFYYSHHSEKFEDAITRFLLFLDYVKTLNYNTILCITHGWFMRLIYIYSLNRPLKEISLRELLEANVATFLDTIEIVID